MTDSIILLFNHWGVVTRLASLFNASMICSEQISGNLNSTNNYMRAE